MLMKNIYNEDGSLTTEAQFLVPTKPEHLTRKEWMKRSRDFKKLLTEEELKELERLKANERCKKYRLAHPEKTRERYAAYYDYEYNKAWRLKNPDKIKGYSKTRYHNNREELLAESKRWSKENPEKNRKNSKKWRKNNLASAKAANARSRIKNREYNNEYSKAWQKAKRKTDPTYRLMSSLRSRCNDIAKCLSLGKKPASTLEMCGCSVEELKKHFESLFTEGMTWENYGRYGWHVDHIRPVCSFSAEEWRLVNHYTNLQPLWAHDNTIKSTEDKKLSRYKQP